MICPLCGVDHVARRKARMIEALRAAIKGSRTW